MIPTRLEGHPSVCGFYTIYAAIHLFKFPQEELPKLTGVNDANLLFYKYSHVIVYQFTVFMRNSCNVINHLYTV